MSSPPPTATSPTSSASFIGSKKRPALHIPTQNKRRKPSSVSSASHPLRQTSFPPPESTFQDVESSPPARQGSFSPSVSSVGGRGKGKKKRGNTARSTTTGRTTKDGDDRSAGPNSSQAADAGHDEDEAADDDDDGAGPEDTLLEGGGMMSEAAKRQEQRYHAMLVDAFSKEQADRYVMWRRVKLKVPTVRKLVNQTLSQSVPGSIVTSVNGYTKVFIGELVEMAREVQAEWLAAERMSDRPKHPGAIAAAHLPQSQSSVNGVNGVNGASRVTLTAKPAAADGGELPNDAATVPPPQDLTQPSNSTDVSQDAGHGAGQLEAPTLNVEERDRGPLTPDHLREALRRYKKDREGGSAGFQGLSMLGREPTASRSGGRRLFR